MNDDEKRFELYRLSVVEFMPDSPWKRDLIQAIQLKLKSLESAAPPQPAAEVKKPQ